MNFEEYTPADGHEVQISILDPDSRLVSNFEGIWSRIRIVCKTNAEFIQGLSTFTRKGESSYLVRKHRPAALARRIVTCSVESAARALPIVEITPALSRAQSADESRSNVHESPLLCAVPCAAEIRTSQLHLGKHGSPGLLFLELECLFKPKPQHVSAVGGRPRRDDFEVFSNKTSRFLVFEVRHDKVPLRLHKLLLAKHACQLSTIDLTV